MGLEKEFDWTDPDDVPYESKEDEDRRTTMDKYFIT